MNTSFNVAAPIAQSPVQALDMLPRANSAWTASSFFQTMGPS